MSMQRYSHEFQKISGSREMVENEDGEWILFEDHEAALASERRANSELAMRERMAEAALAAKDRELALMQRAVEWLLDSTVTRNSEGQLVNWCGPGRVEIPAEFADIIKPASGESNG